MANDVRLRIVLTRPAGRNAKQRADLEQAGHTVSEVPLTRIEAVAAFPDPSEFDGVLFTSVSAVERAPEGCSWPRVGAVGPATADALRVRGIELQVIGAGGGAELAKAWGGCSGQRLLWPRAEAAHLDLGHALVAAGADVVHAAVYRTVALPNVDRNAFVDADVICFHAPSAVEAYCALGVETNARFWARGLTTAAALEAGELPLLDAEL
ncbi:MAG: uroporphyrinogen-III synthase [Planctomycetota bacterium]